MIMIMGTVTITDITPKGRNIEFFFSLSKVVLHHLADLVVYMVWLMAAEHDDLDYPFVEPKNVSQPMSLTKTLTCEDSTTPESN